MRQPHQLFDTPEQKAVLEARNGLLQFEAVEKLIKDSASGFELTPDLLRELQRLAIQDIYDCAGNFRTGNVYIQRNGVIDNTRHQPPPANDVIPRVNEMCKYVNENFGKSAVHLGAYVMWRCNWIHPFNGGNGRTSRAASYLVLCVRLGFNVPGANTIPLQIEREPDPYYEALHLADEADKTGTINITAMEELVSRLLAAQLLSVHDQAIGRVP